MIREAVTSSPLYWPPGWKRTEFRTRSRFGRCSMNDATCETLDELARMGIEDFNVIVSTNVALRLNGLPYSNQRAPEDPGVSVWFSIDGEERVLACDRWDKVEHNLRAIAKHIDALRGMDRWGVGSLEQAFRGYTALPAGDEPRPWRTVLGMHPGISANREAVAIYYKRRAIECHPDTGGSVEKWHELAAAYKEAVAAVSA